MPRLVPPSMTYATSYLEALHEGHTDTTDAHLQVPVDVVEADLAGHIAGLNRPAQTVRPPDGREFVAVPSVHLWLIAGGDFIGRVSVRYELTERLLRSGGHIGYGIRPSRRRQGFGRQALVLAKEHCRQRGLERVLLTCSEDNVGSTRIIESCGGVLESIELRPDPPHEPMRRYWIDL